MGFRANRIIKIISAIILIFKVHVEFSNEFLEVNEDQINIGLKSKPIKGQANMEIIKKLAKHFGVSTTQIKIKSGHKHQEKIIEISH
ncbi:hypothetical protein NKOR_02660 [Candidatus Nitrosopumilus koreensis AR1]|uniref:DUF167 domain-containing protein n=1 Tax=Candidatus Nitrosopumilus koreensis AR1 TaxID=1229908 RepID=K0B7K2_9ARCH|nr:DUF167 domain-containing protein [Nitrosopumilus sp. SJ]AFS80426.1 hypothetical protein NKOR_02660 [Candidatus Nitrosopumilus koreensis AR1]